MAHIPDSVLNEMLGQLPPETRKSLSNIVSGKITHQIHCNGADTYVTVNEPVLDANGNQLVDDDGQLMIEPVQQLARQGCKGDVIAYLYADGLDERRQPKYRVEPVIFPDGKMRLRSSRKRLDGHLGCQCWCGNDSLVARQESGAIQRDGLPPSREGLETIYSALQSDPADYPVVNGAKEVDGFVIEKVTA